MNVDDAIYLQRRALAGFVCLCGSSSAGASVFERDGVTAAIVPAVPERSVVNSVVYRDAEALGAALGELAAAYADAGVRAWTVWTPDRDLEAIRLLELAGHRLDATPAAMTLDFQDLPDAVPVGLDWDDRASCEEVGRINDLAYGFEPGSAFGAALVRPPKHLALRLYRARVDGESVCVLGTLDVAHDCGVYMVATLKGYRGRGLAGRLLQAALAEARERGVRTSTLQSTKLGRPVYERLGYRAPLVLEMWERRK